MKNIIKATLVIGIGTAMLTTGGSLALMQSGGTGNNTTSNMRADDPTMIGNMSREEFNRINAQGNAAVAAIQPTSGGTASKNDQKLMTEVAMGGMMQLEVSRVAVTKATSEEARLLAQSEVEEQTGVSAKLREIAAAKGVTLPSEADSKTQSMVAKMQAMTGAEFDRYYVRESGIKGHEKLEKTMNKVQSRATDESMRSLAAATLPVIRTHQQVSSQVLSKMTGSGNNRGGNSMSGNSNGGSTINGSSNSGGGSVTNGNSNRNSGSGSNTNSNRNAGDNSNMNMNSTTNLNSNTNSNMNSNQDSNSNSNRNSNSNTNRNTNSNTNSNSNSNSNTNSNSNNR